MKEEIKVGLFVLAGILILTIGIFRLENVSFEKFYCLKIIFGDIAGLPGKAKVKIAGVEVGKVDDISLVKGTAEVLISVKQNIKVHQDTQARIVPVGVIGTSYLELTFGSEDKPILKDGDVIVGIDPITYDDAAKRVIESANELIRTVRSIGSKEGLGGSIERIFSDVEGITKNIKDLAGPGSKLKKTMSDFQKASKNLQEITSRINEGKGALGRFTSDKKTEKRIDKILEDLEKVLHKLRKKLRA